MCLNSELWKQFFHHYKMKYLPFSVALNTYVFKSTTADATSKEQ